MVEMKEVLMKPSEVLRKAKKLSARRKSVTEALLFAAMTLSPEMRAVYHYLREAGSRPFQYPEWDRAIALAEQEGAEG